MMMTMMMMIMKYDAVSMYVTCIPVQHQEYSRLWCFLQFCTDADPCWTTWKQL